MINKFDALDYIFGNGQRPFKYKASISLPTELIKVAGALYDNGINVLCKSASTPEVVIKTNSLGLDGRTVNVPVIMELAGTTNMTFYVDQASSVRRLLEYWMFCIDSGVTSKEDKPSMTGSSSLGNTGAKVLNAGAGFLSKATEGVPLIGSIVGGFLGTNSGSANSTDIDMTGTITISLLSYTGTEVSSYTYYNVYPTRVGAYQFRDEDISSICEFEASFNYTHFSYKNKGNLLDKVVNAVV